MKSVPPAFLSLLACGLLMASSCSRPVRPQQAEALYQAGVNSSQQNDYKGAIRCYDQAIKLAPDYAEAYSKRGRAKWQLSDYEGAIADGTKAIELNPTLVDAYINRGNARNWAEDKVGGSNDFTKAIELDPKNTDAYSCRAGIKAALKDHKGAIADFTKAIELNPRRAHLYSSRASIKQDMGDHAGAMADHRKAIELEPDISTAYADLGSLEADLGQSQHALGHFRKAVELAPSWEYPRLRIWLIRAQSGEQPAASKELGEYLESLEPAQTNRWSVTIARFLVERASEETLLQAAAAANDVRWQDLTLFEADYYIGMKRLLAGDKVGAVSFFEKCATSKYTGSPEYKSAAIMIRNIQTPAKTAKE